jgi:hypothetical protein
MSGGYQEAFTLLPTQREVAGFLLKPFSLRHRVLLEAVKSPLVTGSIIVTPDDLLFACKICSCDDIRTMPKKPLMREVLQWIRLNFKKGYFQKCLEEFAAYYKDQKIWPEIYHKQEAKKTRGLPWPLAVISVLVKNGIEYETAWTMPESEAIWMQTAFLVTSGADIDFVTEEDKKAREALIHLQKQFNKQNG